MSSLKRSKALYVALSGILTALAMPGFGAGPLVFVSLVPLLYGLENGRGFRMGMLFGLTFLGLDLRWILTLTRFSPLAVPGFLVLIVYSSLFFGLLGFATARRRNTRLGAGLLVAAPVCFTLMEITRAQGPLGIGFSALYSSLYRIPALIQAAAYLGPWSITAGILAVNVAFYLALRRKQLRYAALGFAFVGSLGAFSLLPFAQNPSRTIDVGIVSSKVLQEVKLDARNLSALTSRYLDLGARAIAEGSDLIVFPESFLPGYILREERLLTPLARLAETGEARILFGTGDVRDSQIYNSVVLLNRDGGIAGQYDMVRPVPFGEYVPGRQIWEAIGLGGLADSFLPRDLTRGEEFEPLDGIGTPICFESTFPTAARRFVINGAQLIVTVTNDAWFVGSSELRAHFAAAVFRAVETHRWVVQAANGGISGIIDPRGVIARATSRERVLRGVVRPREDMTLYCRWGDGPLLVLLGIGAGISLAWRAFRKRDGE
jgi:apolipoprotein N-acyltransferase